MARGMTRGETARYFREQYQVSAARTALAMRAAAHAQAAIGLLPEDEDGTTCPIVFTYPASPHLAAAIDGRDIDLTQIGRSTEKLLQKYDTVLIEGAGGLYVPLSEAYQTIDYVAEHGLPVVLVTSPRLGSINHTLLSLEACRNRNIEVAAVAYNLYPPAPEPIVRDTRTYLKAYLADRFPAARWLEVNDRYELIGPDRP